MTSPAGQPPPPLHVAIVVGEESGDQLGAGLMRALREQAGGMVRFSGVGGRAMAGEGLETLFPLTDIALLGFATVVKALPRIFDRIGRTVAAIVKDPPDVLVIIDSPDFTHRVAKRVRNRVPDIPIVNYVSPSVWAWRSGRARAMRRYVDHVLALLPFEPEAHVRLGGPPCTYVGHTLVQQLSELRPGPEEEARRLADPPVLLILPGSRHSEIQSLLAPFAETVQRVSGLCGTLDLRLPTVPHLADEVSAAVAHWPQRPSIIVDPQEKRAAFRIARAALAASGTVTLELALARVPMVAAYRVSWWEAALARRLINVPSVILANLVLGENVVPELLQEECTPDRLATSLVPLLRDTPERARQIQAFERLDELMEVEKARPSERAAEIVLAMANADQRASRTRGPSLRFSGGA